MMPSKPAGIENALKMREMFQSEYGYKCRIDIEQSLFSDLVARLTVTSASYFACFYFNADGSYYRGSN